MKQIDKENDAKIISIKQQRDALKKRLEHPLLDDDERARLLAQIDSFEKILAD